MVSCTFLVHLSDVLLSSCLACVTNFIQSTPKLEQQANDLESASNDLEVLCSNHSNSLLESRTIIEEKHRQRTEAEDRIRTKLIELQNLRHEGERLQQIEEVGCLSVVIVWV